MLLLREIMSRRCLLKDNISVLQLATSPAALVANDTFILDILEQCSSIKQ